ncbi:hypothetical protein M422DRAFT_59864 [Sphaerobolus stellatus SS14]|uniref:Peptidase M24 domain-containing protein n=1 Tax=Sphaerobolus stellatus (strain SS14) TaxID=990650 RepID=A0A0C9VS82_SPHS4|nr:hypothetical protein M422DRAFT_59864 [Sphaerobolus stellatus SS14]
MKPRSGPIAFPTGLSTNNCAAHYSPNPGDKTVLQPSDVLKVGFGVQVKGKILNSAYTMTFEPTYDSLLEAVKAGTNAGIKSILLVRNIDQTKMEEGEYYAIDTFGSTGSGRVIDDDECSHFGKSFNSPPNPSIRLNSAHSFFKTINKNFGTLPFCRRHLDCAGETKNLLSTTGLRRRD